MDKEDFIKMLISGVENSELGAGRDECERVAKDFIKNAKRLTNLERGTPIVRNRFGQGKYKHPNSNSFAYVEKCLDEPITLASGTSEHADMIITVVGGIDQIHTFFVDSRFYSVEADKSNVAKFKR